MKLTLPVVVLILAAAAAPAEAQLCAGAPSFRESHFQAGVDAAFSQGAQGVGGSFAVGSTLFGGVSFNVTSFSDLDTSSKSVAGTAGADMALGRDRRAFACPMAGVGFGTGPDVGPLDISTFHAGGGGQLGVVAAESGDLMVVPTFGLAAMYRRISAEFRGLEEEESDTYGLATMGVGFIFNQNIGITPGISIPFSIPDPDVAFSLRFAFNF